MVIKFACKSLFLVAFAMICGAQQPAHNQSSNPPNVDPPLQAPVTAGLETPWDVRTILARLTSDTDQLKTVIDHLSPQQWLERKGAPSTYILQWQAAQQQLTDVSTVTKQLTQKTESLPLALDDYFRFEVLDVTTRSLEEGVRRYGERSLADKLSQLIASNFNNRERFRDYIRDLATSTEQNFKIADEEAQRCRGIISKEPAASSKRLRK